MALYKYILLKLHYMSTTLALPEKSHYSINCNLPIVFADFVRHYLSVFIHQIANLFLKIQNVFSEKE